MGFHYQSPFAPVEAFFPPWLQIILFGYVGIVLMDWAIELFFPRDIVQTIALK